MSKLAHSCDWSMKIIEQQALDEADIPDKAPLEITNPADVQAFILGNHRIRLEAAERIAALEEELSRKKP